MRLLLLAICLALVSVQAGGSSARAWDSEESNRAVVDWVVKQGGVVKGEIRNNAIGVRGLFATQDIAPGDDILRIPESATINGGNPILAYMREAYTPCSRFRPYLDMLPPGDSVLNACTMPMGFVKLLQAPFWEQHVASYQDHVSDAWSGRIRDSLEYTFEDVLGDRNVSLAEVQAACALVVSRYFQNKRDRVVMIPVFDIANHWYQCSNHIKYGDNGVLRLVASEPLKKGDEICFGYGSLRDDYAVFHYGFVPPEEDPPRLLAVDHPEFDEEKHNFNDLSDEPFEGTAEEVQEEVERLQTILNTRGDIPPPAVREDQRSHPGVELVLQLRARRVKSLRVEVERLQALLAGATGKQEL